jgi:hypothetical protein
MKWCSREKNVLCSYTWPTKGFTSCSKGSFTRTPRPFGGSARDRARSFVGRSHQPGSATRDDVATDESQLGDHFPITRRPPHWGQFGWPSFTPCQAFWARPSISLRLARSFSCSTSHRSRRAFSRVTKRCTSACLSTTAQSNQLVSLSCNRCCWRSGSSSPGDCAASRSRDCRSALSTPQFQLRLSSEPSRLPSPLASLCFRS